jgi:formylglycine-generating enzyme required for sulfatase activity
LRLQGYSAWPFDAAEARRRQEETARTLGIPAEKVLDLGNGVTMKLMLIPAGEFVMGSPEGEAERGSDEGPQHRVRITKPFYMGATEVTQAQWQSAMGRNPSSFQGSTNPVEQVMWDDCEEFCRRAGHGLRLPTEAEWECACRAGTSTPFNTGETISTGQANYDGLCIYGAGPEGVYRLKTVPAGSFAPNGWGLYDMHGNVLEWCADWYAEGYYGQSPTEDPQGPSGGQARVLRGGSWLNKPGYCRSACRYCPGSTLWDYNIGFRVVAPAPTP